MVAVTDLEVAKRPKLELHASNTSSGTVSSGASQHGGDSSTVQARVETSASSTGPWPSDSHTTTAAGVLKLSVALGSSNSQSPPNIASPTVLPGYRESIYGGTQQSLPRREAQREDSSALQKFPRLASISDRPPSLPSTPKVDILNPTGSLQHSHRTAQAHSHPPPLLTSESTNRSSTSASSASTGSFFTPHTPMEPPLERALPIPSLYPQKSYETQLPPLRPPSLSPQSTNLGHSPNGAYAELYSIVDKASLPLLDITNSHGTQLFHLFWSTHHQWRLCEDSLQRHKT